MKSFLLFLLFISLTSAIFAQEATSILRVQLISAVKLHKTLPTNSNFGAGTVDQTMYRGYTINVQPDGRNYDLQIFTMVQYGSLKVNSIYASQFQSSVEYTYSYDASQHVIRQDHFLFPPNSLTGWANPDDYVTMRQFDWGSRFPAGCSSSIYTSEEFGREYLESSCFQTRDSALIFAKKFINYALSKRGL
jgi:hypothetical protein